jgi:hypothetical protein
MKKFKRGDVREDGKVFRNYTCRGTEWWVDPEKLDKMRDRNKKERKSYRENNKEKVASSYKKWYAKNSERVKLYLREWRRLNKDKVNQASREWNKNNPDKVKEMLSNRIAKNRDSYLAIKRAARLKRRAMLEGSFHQDHDKQIEMTLISQCQSLEKRLGIKFEVDHIVPISKGGFHHHLNLHVIPAYWNRVKHTKDIDSIPQCWNPSFRKN